MDHKILVELSQNKRDVADQIYFDSSIRVIHQNKMQGTFVGNIKISGGPKSMVQ